MSIKEMDGEDEAGGEQGFVRMNDERKVDHPAGHEPGEKGRKPHEHAGDADDQHAPEHREIVELLPIRPAIELRLRALAKKPFVVGNEIAPVFHGRHHGIRAEEHREQPLETELAIRGIAQ